MFIFPTHLKQILRGADLSYYTQSVKSRGRFAEERQCTHVLFQGQADYFTADLSSLICNAVIFFL